MPDTMRLGQLMYHVNKTMIKKLNDSLRPLDVTLQQSLIIGFLYKNQDKKITQRMIEKAMNNTNPTTTNTLKAMVSRNLIYKIQDKDDGRKYYLYLTPHALEIAPLCIEKMDQTDNEQIRKYLSDEEIQTLIKLLTKINWTK